jgi:hypothetical protein
LRYDSITVFLWLTVQVGATTFMVVAALRGAWIMAGVGLMFIFLPAWKRFQVFREHREFDHAADVFE